MNLDLYKFDIIMQDRLHATLWYIRLSISEGGPVCNIDDQSTAGRPDRQILIISREAEFKDVVC